MTRPINDPSTDGITRSPRDRASLLPMSQTRSAPSTEGDLAKGVFPFSIVSQALSGPSIMATWTASVRISVGVEGGLTGGGGDTAGAGEGGAMTDATVGDAAPTKLMTGLPYAERDGRFGSAAGDA